MLILIADDDRLVRFTIKSILGDLLGDSGDIFLEAANGRDMVRLCQEQRPDIAFVDIRMPYVNGLDAISESRKYSPLTEYVIVSGYSDFEYAQMGIRLGINEYLLKPIDEEELEPVMEKLKAKLKKQKVEFNSRFQLQIMDTFNYYSTIGVEKYTEEPDEKDYEYLTFLLYIKSGGRERKKSLDLQKSIVKEIKMFGEEVVWQKGHYAIANTGEGVTCIVFGVTEGMRQYVLSHIRKISMSASVMESCFHYFLWFQRKTLEEVYKTCELIDSQAYFLLERRAGIVEEYGVSVPEEYEKRFLCQVEKLLDAWEQADGISCKEIMNRIWMDYREKEPTVNLKNLSEYCSAVCGCKISDESLKMFCQSFVEHSDQLYSGLAGEENNVIEQVKVYIQKYYMNDISVSQIAEHFGLTANYLSTIFHRKSGSKFIDYLTEVRIEAAKKILIQNTSASVQDVALMVGYNSARHFSALFQKQMGETPSVYRKSKL